MFILFSPKSSEILMASLFLLNAVSDVEAYYLKLMILLPLPPKCQDHYSGVTPHPTSSIIVDS